MVGARSLTLTDLDPIRGSVTLAIDPKGHTTIVGATATGKTVSTECLAAPYTGRVPPLHPDAERGGFEVSTAKATIRIGVTRRGTGSWAYKLTGDEDFTRVSSYSDLAKLGATILPALGPACDGELAECIISPRALEELYATDRTAFRAMLLRALPPVDLRARIVDAVDGLTLADLVVVATVYDKEKKIARLTTTPKRDKQGNVIDHDHPDYAEELVDVLKLRQRDDNATEAGAQALARDKASALAKLVPVAEPDETAIAAALETVRLADAWAEYDRRVAAYDVDLAAWTTGEEKRATWQASRDALGKRPDVDSGALMVAGQALRDAQAALRAGEEAERNAAEQERIATATAKATADAEAKAAADLAREVADAEERGRQQAQGAASPPPPVAPPPVVPVRRPEPKPVPQPSPVLFVAADTRPPLTRTFTRAQLVDEFDLPRNPGAKDYSKSGVVVVENEITGTRRWSVDNWITFRLPDMPDGYAYGCSYSVGATESQDERPWEHEDPVTCQLMHLEEKTVQVWTAVKENA